MSRNVLVALLLMALSVLIMIFNHSTVALNLLFVDVRPVAALVYLCFMGVGVIIGVLLNK